MNLSIAEASGRDIPVILDLLYELGRPKPCRDQDVDAFRGKVKGYMADPDKGILVARLDDIEIVGMASVMFLQRLNHATPEMYIPELVVPDKSQRLGIGTALINRCVALAEGRGCHRIRLESGNLRRGSHEFYRAAGFEQSALSFEKRLPSESARRS